MSHIAKINMSLGDLDTLDEVLPQFGASLKRGKTNFKAYAGTNTKCNHVIELDNEPNAYSIGLRQLAQAEEAYEPVCDWYDGKLSRVFGTGGEKLRTEYSAALFQKTAPRGYRFQREETATHLTMRAIG